MKKSNYAFWGLAIVSLLILFSFSFQSLLFGGQNKISGNPLPHIQIFDHKEEAFWADESFLGKKTMILFWATWCAPCKEELQWVMKDRKNIEKKGWRLVLLNSDSFSVKKTQEKIKSIEGFSNDLIEYSLYDKDNALLSAMEIPALPFAIKLDEKGKVFWTKTGEIKKSDF